ncbi:MAG: hypothetical protein HC773_05590 [Scytonema sp. CRU_2_7]|nr:hypothetical protein [Scytonema sp. CRU_2_7]
MDVLQAIFEQLQIISECLCEIRDAVKEEDLDVKYDTCEFTSSGKPQLEEQTWKIKPPKFLHDTIQKIVDEFIDIKSTEECEKNPTIQVSIEPTFITCGDDDPETVDNCKIILKVPDSADISITGLPQDQISSKRNGFVTFFDAYFELFFGNVYDSLNNRYGQRDPLTGYFVNAQGNPVQNIDPVDVKRVIPDDALNCINAAWFSALISWTIIVPLIDGEKHYADILAATLARINSCYQQESLPCVPVFYGEIREKEKFPPQLHLYHELEETPSDPKERRYTWMVIPFPKFPNDDPLQFDPLPFQLARRKIGKLYCQARWQNFNPTGDTTAAYFDNGNDATVFFDTYIFPYCKLEPVESDPDPITGITTKITKTEIANKNKRLTDKTYRISRILYLKFDKDGNIEECRDWKIEKV